MSSFTRYLVSTFSLVCGSLWASDEGSVVHAQARDRDAIDEIVVTASRREEELQDVSMTVAVIEIDDYVKSGRTGLAEILPFVSGIVVADDGGTSRNEVYIRGITATGAAGIGTYVDDIPFGSSTQFAGGGSPIDGALLDLDRMEVLKGPQGTLYGASAMGGLLRFKTKEASLDRWLGNVSVDLSSTEHGGLNQLYRASASGPLVQDSLGVSLAGFWKEKTGYVDNVVLQHRGKDDFEFFGGSAKLLFAPSEKVRMRLQTFYQKSQQPGFATIQASNETGQPIFGRFETGELGLLPNVFESRLLGAGLDYDLGWATFASVSSYQEVRYNQVNDATLILGPLLDLFFPGNAPHTSVKFDVDVGFDKFTQELRLTSVSNRRLEWLVGGFYSVEDSFNGQVANSVPPEPGFLAISLPFKYEEIAAFGTATYHFTPKIDASFGIRHSENDSTTEITAVGPLIASVPEVSESQSVTTYLFNVRYQPSDNLTLYVRAANGYRPGGANAVAFDADGNPTAPPFFLADELWSYEVGLRGSAFDGRAGFDVAAFSIDWRDYQIFIIRNGIGVIGNAHEAVSEGAEATLRLMPTDALTFVATASYVDARLGVDEPDLGGGKGDQLPNAPKWSASFQVNYDFTMGAVPAFVSGAYRYTDKFPVSFDGVTVDGAFFPSASPSFVNGSFGVVDLHAGFSTDRFDGSIYVTNLFDEYAYTNFATNSTQPAFATVLRPRTIGVVLTAKF